MMKGVDNEIRRSSIFSRVNDVPECKKEIGGRRIQEKDDRKQNRSFVGSGHNTGEEEP